MAAIIPFSLSVFTVLCPCRHGLDDRKLFAFQGRFISWDENGKGGKEGNVWEAPMDGGVGKEAMIENVSIRWAQALSS